MVSATSAAACFMSEAGSSMAKASRPSPATDFMAASLAWSSQDAW